MMLISDHIERSEKKLISDVSIIALHRLTTRSKASHGLWLSGLLPLSCCPGLYAAYSQCETSILLSLLSIQVGISSLFILHDLCSSLRRDDTPSSSRRNLRKIIHYFPPVLNYFAVIYFTRTHHLVAVGCVALCHYLQFQCTEWLFVNFGRSFSAGEGLLVGQAAAVVLTLSLKGVMRIPSLSASFHQQITSFVQVAVLTCFIFGLIIWRNKTKMNWISLTGLLAVMGCFGLCGSSVALGVGSLPWLFRVISTSSLRIALIGWWTNVSVLIFLSASMSQRYPNISQTIMRKMFHIFVVLIFLPGIILDPSFTYLASSGAAMLFILLELIRVCRIKPVSSLLDSIFSVFLDEKDEGPLVLSHIYLLVGIACPLWLYPCSFSQLDSPASSVLLSNLNSSRVHFSVLPLMAGLTAVGVGDTAASLGGTYIGKHKWPGTKKTIEGTVCSILCQLAFIALIMALGALTLSFSSWPKILVSIVISAIVEAFTDQVDNIILPLLLYTPLMDP